MADRANVSILHKFIGMSPATLKIMICLVAILVAGVVSGQPRPVRSNVALVGARIYPSPTDSPIDNGVVLIRNGKIVAVGAAGTIKVPSSYSIIDCKDLTLTAAFWNCHVHFIEPNGRMPTSCRLRSSTSRWSR